MGMIILTIPIFQAYLFRQIQNYLMKSYRALKNSG